MKKRVILWTVLTVCTAVLNGCIYKNNLHTSKKDFEEYQTKYTEEIKETQESVITPQTERNTQDQQDTEKLEEIPDIPQIYYAYHALDSNRQKIYLEILTALTNMEIDAHLSTLDKSVIDPVFACVMNDHPELFYVEGYQYTEYTFANTVTKITFSGTYSMTQPEVENTRLIIEQKLQECFSQIPWNGDEYDIVKYLYEWLVNHTEYDKTAENNQNICSVFLQGRSVCQGYAKAMQYMLQRSGIQCLLVTGFTDSERHAWNLVNVNDAYYYLDPTWGDASYSYNSAEKTDQTNFPTINYDYFLVTTDEITRTHTFERVVELPECTATNDNYYVREKLYFETYDDTRLLEIFRSDTVKTANYATIKCSDAQNYAIMIQTLIEQQKIFDMIDREGISVAYASNSEQYTISFWNIY